jgi:Cell wall-active antibiotics response 4TMS YvqF
MVTALVSDGMRLIRTLLVLSLGFWAGLTSAAVLVKRMLPSRGDATSDEVSLFAIFGGVELKSRSQAFRGGTMLAWYGGVAVDLREAELAPGAELSAGALWGGVAITVPEGWRVEAQTSALAGGVDVKVPQPEDPDAPTLKVKASAAFGGVAIAAEPLSAPVTADAVAAA